MNDRQYLIIPSTEIKKIDFNKIHESSESSLSYSGDGKKTFIKWTGEAPEFVSTLKNTKGPYTHQEILEIIRGDAWNKKTKTKVT